MNTQVSTMVRQSGPSLLMDPNAFAHMQRVGAMLALSPLFPEHLRKGAKETGIANGVLVMNMASRLNEDPLTVAQNIYFVGGKPGWSSSYMISKANQHGVFKDPIDWEVKGKGQDLSVTAFGVLRTTGKRVQVTCDMAMAKAEGWTKNPKYQTMPEQMLRYRSATFLIRLYCPEVMVGVPSVAEIEAPSMRDVTPDDAPVIDFASAEGAPIEDAEPVVQDEAKPVHPATQRASTRDATPYTEMASTPPREARPQEPPAEDKAAQYQAIVNRIAGDMLDGADPAELLQGFAPEIAQMKAEAPGVYENLKAEVAGFAPDLIGTF